MVCTHIFGIQNDIIFLTLKHLIFTYLSHCNCYNTLSVVDGRQQDHGYLLFWRPAFFYLLTLTLDLVNVQSTFLDKVYILSIV